MTTAKNLQTYIGALAVESGFIMQEQLDLLIEQLDQEDSQTPIGDSLIERGWINAQQLEQLKKKREINLRKIQAEALLEYIRVMKLIPEDQLAKCLEQQERVNREQNTYIPVETFWITRNLVTEEKIKEIKKSKKVQRVVRQADWSNDPRRTGLKGRVLGGYEILSKIAAGGMGVVYRSVQIELERTVALKILFPKFASNKKHLGQFFREAKLSAALNHPNLVHTFDMGRDQGFFYYAMELVEGENLGDLLHAKGKFKQQEALDIIIQAARGLDHIHSFDIVHRDIKPSNFMIRGDGIVKIMDLGLAREMTEVQKKASTFGTPHYMAPELINNPQEANHRADIYALGVSFYKMITGEYPISGTDAKEILKNIPTQSVLPVRKHDPSLAAEIEAVIMKMIEKDVQARYQRLADVLSDLDRILLD